MRSSVFTSLRRTLIGHWSERGYESHTHNAVGATICSKKERACGTMTHTHFEETGNLLLLMQCSGFHKESCLSAAVASLTSDTVPTELN